MLQVEYTSQFKRDLKLAKRPHVNLALLERVMNKIVHEDILEPKYRDHSLTGNWGLS